MTKSFSVVIVACLLALVPQSTGAADGSRQTQEVYRGFFQTVFGLEYGRHADANRVKRFATQVRFHVSDRSGSNRLRTARAFLRSLPRHIKHFRGVEVGDQSKANFRLLIVRRADFAAVVRRELKADAVAMNARCLVGVTTRNGRIQRSLAIIVGDDDYLFRRCLVEEVLQGLGPMNDDPGLSQSVFNDTSRHTTFTAFDQAILNVLYHPAIKPGMSGAEVHRAMPRALRDLGYR